MVEPRRSSWPAIRRSAFCLALDPAASGLRAYGTLVEGCAFTDEILPLPDPEAPGR